MNREDLKAILDVSLLIATVVVAVSLLIATGVLRPAPQ